MRIAILGAGHVGSTLGRLWHADGHDVTFAARDATRPQALAAELGARAARRTTSGDSGAWPPKDRGLASPLNSYVALELAGISV